MGSWASPENEIDRLESIASRYSRTSGNFTPLSMRTPNPAELVWGDKGDYGVSGEKGPPPYRSPEMRYEDIYDGSPHPVMAEAEYHELSPEQIATSSQYSYKYSKFHCVDCLDWLAGRITIAHRMSPTHRRCLEMLRTADLPYKARNWHFQERMRSY
jgi:hypothetical protein